MFTHTEDQLKELGAHITTKEIAQQPDLWLDTYTIYQNNKEAIDAFLADAASMGDKTTQVIFTGAGTSAYVGDTILPSLGREGVDTFFYRTVPTTDIVSAPLSYLDPETPVVLVSFARSGNSPESLAAVKIADQVVDNIRFLNITCALEGKLAVESKDDERALTLLIPGANDQGFAMTGSYTCMALLANLIFEDTADEYKKVSVELAASMGRNVVDREDEICSYLEGNFDRVTYLGSGVFGGLAREAQLKVLELAAGRVATSFDTSMGYRHGPKSFVNEKTLVFDFVSNDLYTRDYDLDILNEIAADDIACHTVAIQQANGVKDYEGKAFTLTADAILSDVYLALPFAMFAQTVSLNTSVKVGNTPDTPSANGTVNRVVKGVTIHPFGLEE